MLDWTPFFENAFWHSSLIVSVVVIVNSSPSIPPGIRRGSDSPVLSGSFPGCRVVLPAELGYRDVRVQGLHTTIISCPVVHLDLTAMSQASASVTRRYVVGVFSF
jgi:hypothetical protein